MTEQNAELNYLELAEGFYENGNYTDALNCINNENNDTTNPEYWHMACKIHLILRDFIKADEAISNALRIDKTNAEYWYLKARANIGLGLYKKALRASNKSIELNNTYEYRHLNDNILNFLNDTPFQYSFDEDTYVPDYSNVFDDVTTIGERQNIDLLKKRRLSSTAYQFILDNIAKDAIDMTSLDGDIFTKTRNFVENFAEVDYSFEGKVGDIKTASGAYGFNMIKIDSSLVTTLQIAALIHELTHHLLSEIFEQALMYIFNSPKTDAIEAFAWYALSNRPEWLLMNEYCAHTVEGHYIPFPGENYESFNSVLENFDTNNPDDVEKIKKATLIGNTFAQDIIYILDQFFTQDLRNEIKEQFVIDRFHWSQHRGTEFKTNDIILGTEKFRTINSILRQNLWDIKLDNDYSKLFYFRQLFEKNNQN